MVSAHSVSAVITVIVAVTVTQGLSEEQTLMVTVGPPSLRGAAEEPLWVRPEKVGCSTEWGLGPPRGVRLLGRARVRGHGHAESNRPSWPGCRSISCKEGSYRFPPWHPGKDGTGCSGHGPTWGGCQGSSLCSPSPSWLCLAWGLSQSLPAAANHRLGEIPVLLLGG